MVEGAGEKKDLGHVTGRAERGILRERGIEIKHSYSQECEYGTQECARHSETTRRNLVS